MKLRVLVLGVLFLTVLTNLMCLAEDMTHEYDALIERVIQEVKNEWLALYSEMPDDQSNGYFEIKNTRLIKISDTPKAFVENSEGFVEEKDLERYFGNIKYIVEFMIFVNYLDTAPYYDYSYRCYSATIYDDLTIKVESYNSYLDTFSTKTYIENYEGIIEETIDFGSRFNQSCDLLDKSNVISKLSNLFSREPNVIRNPENITDEYDDMIEEVIQEVKKEWLKQVYLPLADRYKNGYFEIKNTRLIVIKDYPTVQGVSAEEYFGNVKYIVEFMLLDNFQNKAPLYGSHTGRYNSVRVFDDLTIQVEAHGSYFDTFTSRTYVLDYSGIIKEIIDFGDRFNQSCDLLSPEQLMLSLAE